MIKKQLAEELMSHCNEYLLDNLKNKQGYGPFAAFIVDNEGKIIQTALNEVQIMNNCVAHAETLAIVKLQEKLGTYDLGKYDYTLIATSEPCMMCAGTILWSGIKQVYYGASTKDIETILGFDEGVKTDWINQFNKRGIEIIGNIERQACVDVLKFYKENDLVIYNPTR